MEQGILYSVIRPAQGGVLNLHGTKYLLAYKPPGAIRVLKRTTPTTSAIGRLDVPIQPEQTQLALIPLSVSFL